MESEGTSIAEAFDNFATELFQIIQVAVERTERSAVMRNQDDLCEADREKSSYARNKPTEEGYDANQPIDDTEKVSIRKKLQLALEKRLSTLMLEHLESICQPLVGGKSDSINNNTNVNVNNSSQIHIQELRIDLDSSHKCDPFAGIWVAAHCPPIRRPVYCLIDCNSQLSIISSRLMTEGLPCPGAPTIPTTDNIGIQHRHSATQVNEYATISVRVLEKTRDFVFVVTDNNELDADVILGWRFLNEFGISVDFKNAELSTTQPNSQKVQSQHPQSHHPPVEVVNLPVQVAKNEDNAVKAKKSNGCGSGERPIISASSGKTLKKSNVSSKGTSSKVKCSVKGGSCENQKKSSTSKFNKEEAKIPGSSSYPRNQQQSIGWNSKKVVQKYEKTIINASGSNSVSTKLKSSQNKQKVSKSSTSKCSVSKAGSGSSTTCSSSRSSVSKSQAVSKPGKLLDPIFESNFVTSKGNNSKQSFSQRFDQKLKNSGIKTDFNPSSTFQSAPPPNTMASKWSKTTEFLQRR